MVVQVAKQYHKHRLDFCIISFTTLNERAIIEALENADLPSERVTTWIVFRVCALVVVAMTDANFKLSFVRERGRLCDPVFCSDKVAGFLKSHLA